MNNKERNIGLDLLRIISMIMVITLHYLVKGGLLETENVSKFYYVVYYTLEFLSIVAVNCYVLISGYFLVKSEFKIKKFFKLWGEVIFYSAVIYIIIASFGLVPFSIKAAIKSFFPVITNQYWFVNTYLVMYLLSPFFNRLINNISKMEYKKLITILTILFCIFSALPSEMSLDSTGGYGIIWFTCLYFIAGYISLHISSQNINKYKIVYLIIYILCVVLNVFGTILIDYISNIVGINSFRGKLIGYNMPLVLIESLCLFMYFKSSKIKNKTLTKFITLIAPLTFAVYVIHEQPQLVTVLYTNILHTDICYHNPYGILIVISSVLGMFTICTTIEFIRKRIVSTKPFKTIGNIFDNIIEKVVKLINKLLFSVKE